MKENKKINEITEFFNFIKNFYTNYIALNFDDYFLISFDGNDVKLSFPEKRFSLLVGKIDLSNSPRFLEFVKANKGSIRVNNDKLDLFRKCRKKDLHDEPCNKGESYDFNFDHCIKDKETKEETIIPSSLIMKREEYNFPKVPDDSKFIYEIEIPTEFKNKTLLEVYMNDNKLTFDKSNVVVFDCPVYNFDNIFKDKAETKYCLRATDKIDGFRYVKLIAHTDMCDLTQYFRVI